MASLNGKRTYNACQCVLKKIPFPSSTKSNPTTSRASPTTTKSTTTKKDPETTTTRPSVKPSSTSHITTSSRSTSTSSGWTRTTITTTIISTTTTTISTTTTTRTTTTTTTTASTTTTTVAPTTTSTSACPDAPTTIAQSIKPFRKRGGVPDITMNYTLTSSGFNSVLSGGSTSTTTTFNNTQIALTDLVTSCVGFGEQYQDFRTDEWQVNLYYQDVVDPYWSCALVSFDAQPPASYVKAVDPTIGCSYDYYGTTNFGD
ncbi:hypothetical protein K461DRAFT_68938 [Myriangium duriaei CBS 260.36]|uniref:Uncharacterized protein n=1 Tax=Myriangium duriaei CBS 260.36 TaxID=1168546 RepID=A0A9P4IWP5_9PEZI|nr:hypothetical protein K461DRAFT_68938 [Myriangium duriaei CBS 260.36]